MSSNNKCLAGSRLKKCILLTGIILVLIIIIIFLPIVKTLSIGSLKNLSKSIYSCRALNGFIISYTHSVNKGRVRDYYEYSEKNGLELVKTIFVSYGAGIPEPYETDGAVFKLLPEGYEISGLNRKVPVLLMAVGLIAEHSITIDGQTFFLKDFFPPQISLVFEVKKISIFKYLNSRRF